MLNKLISRTLITAGFLLSISALAHAVDYEVVTIDAIDSNKRTMILGDRIFSFTPFLIVQDYDGAANQRLPLSSLKVGNWVVYEEEYNEASDTFGVSVIKLLKGKAQAEQLIQLKISN